MNIFRTVQYLHQQVNSQFDLMYVIQFVLSFLTPENDPEINLLFLMGKQHSMPELYHQDHLSTLGALKHAQLSSQSILFNQVRGQFRLESIFDKYAVIKAYQANLLPTQKVYIQMRLNELAVLVEN